MKSLVSHLITRVLLSLSLPLFHITAIDPDYKNITKHMQLAIMHLERSKRVLIHYRD